MEYLLVHRGGRGQSFVYELLFDGDLATPNPQLMGLIQPDCCTNVELRIETSRGSEGEFAGSTRPQNGAIAVGSRGDNIPETPQHEGPTANRYLKPPKLRPRAYLKQPTVRIACRCDLGGALEQCLTHSGALGLSEGTLDRRRSALRSFIAWCEERA